MTRLHAMMLGILLLGGTLVPPSLFAQEYLLFTASLEMGQAVIYQMDADGNISFREQHPISAIDSETMALSPDGRMVVIGSGGTANSNLSIFFIRDSGTLSPPQTVTSPNMGVWYENPIAFHDHLPVFYAGNYPQMASFEYDCRTERVTPTGDSFSSTNYASDSIGYSSWAKALFFQWKQNYYADSVQMVQIKSDGSFGAMGQPLSLPANANEEFAVSPDGRWAAALGTFDPKLMFIAIGQDGATTVTDSVNTYYNQFNVRFSPNSRRLYMLGENPDKMLVSYDIDPTTGKLSERSYVSGGPGTSYTYGMPILLTLTPDERYAVFRNSQYINDPSRNFLHVVRIHEDGRLEYLPDKRVLYDQPSGAMAFTFLPHNAARPEWARYE